MNDHSRWNIVLFFQREIQELLLSSNLLWIGSLQVPLQLNDTLYSQFCLTIAKQVTNSLQTKPSSINFNAPFRNSNKAKKSIEKLRASHIEP